MQAAVPWHARAREGAQRLGIDPRDFRRFRWFHKARTLRTYEASVRRNLAFVLADPEPHNFTYEISNSGELAVWVGHVTGTDADAALALIREPDEDEDLRARLRRATHGHWLWSKQSPPFGKRLGWYAIARALRPHLIVETGVHDGLGTMLLLRALERNEVDGNPGRLVSFDINPAAGWLVGEHPRWEFRVQSSRDGLREMLSGDREVDMFIYDGWHSYDEEHSDLTLVAGHLSPAGVLISDDAQVTSALADVCTASGLNYFSVYTRPSGHFHPGTVLAAGRR